MNSFDPIARPAHHHLSVRRQIGSLSLDADLSLNSTWTILFGPSGSGKSSLLRAACGLLGRHGIRFTRSQENETQPLSSIPPQIRHPERSAAQPKDLPHRQHHLNRPNPSTLVLQDETTFVPPHLRGVRWAPQNDSLFPHLTVHENILFGPFAASAPPEPAMLDEIIALFKLDPLLDRSPRDLSGGERRRVALARAFAAPGCRLMLLDEPFNGIDRKLRDELLPRMRVWLRDNGIPALSVTHDVEEAMQLQADVVLVRDGRVERQGHVTEVLSGERDRLLRALAFAPKTVR